MNDTGTSGVFAREYDDLDAVVEVGFAGGRVIAVSFPGAVADDADTEHALLDRIGDYLRGDRETFGDIDTALTVPTDRRAVLDALDDVPYGESVSVSRLTRLAGLDDNEPEDLELVTSALRANPIPILIADHRVEGGPYATPGDVRATLRRLEDI
ncbi:methylated-DNA-[protein]-cysteine S-methyltransferase [Halorubrum alkaliphilum]|uniref:Methylated-DNA-[protein]-cysteine S-methyltransferase n=1 Tax=Halorubrum alkaliphilum TaxID=261290 RepID=A0A8T4G9U2_9EURY|nr:MGMT family protein [Halorubrum alkaliphilum]MBP1921188.1 methylated-DNA-[protein]-cysteine S-methyltransferase [Halorubrum alkaliphilum]